VVHDSFFAHIFDASTNCKQSITEKDIICLNDTTNRKANLDFVSAIHCFGVSQTVKTLSTKQVISLAQATETSHVTDCKDGTNVNSLYAFRWAFLFLQTFNCLQSLTEALISVNRGRCQLAMMPWIMAHSPISFPTGTLTSICLITYAGYHVIAQKLILLNIAATAPTYSCLWQCIVKNKYAYFAANGGRSDNRNTVMC
jgi:hypothetical protein